MLSVETLAETDTSIVRFGSFNFHRFVEAMFRRCRRYNATHVLHATDILELNAFVKQPIIFGRRV